MKRQIFPTVRVSLTAVLIFASVLCVLASQDANRMDQCSLYSTPEEGSKGRPLIWGKPYVVPSLHLSFVDKESGEAVKPSKVDVFYIWQWIEYPYPDHPWGAWSNAHDWVRCLPNDGGALRIPPFTVKPRGWYDGKYTKFPWSKKPYFDYLEITVHLDECAPKLRIDLKDLKRYQRERAMLRVSCGSPIEATFGQSPPK